MKFRKNRICSIFKKVLSKYSKQTFLWSKKNKFITTSLTFNKYKSKKKLLLIICSVFNSKIYWNVIHFIKCNKYEIKYYEKNLYIYWTMIIITINNKNISHSCYEMVLILKNFCINPLYKNVLFVRQFTSNGCT